MNVDEELQALLQDQLDARSVQEVQSALASTGRSEPVLNLLRELGDISLKVQSEAVRALGELAREKDLSCVVTWLDLGITLAQTSGALALRFFKESPVVLRFLASGSRTNELLGQVLELADESSETAPRCAFEFFKVLPQLPDDMDLTAFRQWAVLGTDLAEWDYVLGNEFFRECPSIIKAIPLESAKAWIAFGMKLMVRNTLGKPDYVGTLEFFRTSPSLFAEIPEPEVKHRVIDMGIALAERSPEYAVLFLAESPRLLSMLPSEDWKHRVLKYGLLIADRDAEAALAYFRRVPEVILHSDPADTAVFDAWYGQGMEALAYGAEAGRAFFGLETRQACSAVEQSMIGIPLRQVLRSLKMFARALCGEDVNIESLDRESIPQQGLHNPAATTEEGSMVSRDGKTIYLPLVMSRSSSMEGNRRWYTAMVAHEVGHLEFGTYRVSSQILEATAEGVQGRYLRTGETSSCSIRSLGDLFNLYPQPGLIRDLWEILEDARVDFLLQEEYPGLREDFKTLSHETVQLRTLSHGMTIREMVLDALLLRFSGLEKHVVAEPGIEDVIDPVWEMARSILNPDATVDDSVGLADRVYQELQHRVGQWKPSSGQPESFPGESGEEHAGIAHEAAERLESEYEPFENWGYRNALDPHALSGVSEDSGDQTKSVQQSPGGRGTEGQGVSMGDPAKESGTGSPLDKDKQETGTLFGESPLDQWFQPEVAPTGNRRGLSLGHGQFLYEEWDGLVGDYRPRWTRVIEQEATEGSPDFVDETLKTYGPVVKLIRRYFECIRPEAFRRIGRQSDGEEIDFDAMVNWLVDRKRGSDPSDQIYARREKRDRHVAVAFLIDMSGSTARQLGSRGRTVNDIEKESLLLLSEALTAVGDQFAIYGFSGKSRQSVDLQVLKDFAQRAGGRVGLRISGVRPRQQNRDGAAIRHATFRLMEQSAKVRMMVLLSDGKPLDDDYTDEYALADTKMALREARLNGIHPFCITIDQAASDYVKRMYGEVGYLVVDEIDSLPTRLPKIYQRLTAK